MKNDVVLHPVDKLGAIRAQIADLRKQEKDVEIEVKAAIGTSQKLDGSLFSATLVVQIRESIDPAKVRELCHANTVKACTRVTEVQSLRVSARPTAKLPVEAA